MGISARSVVKGLLRKDHIGSDRATGARSLHIEKAVGLVVTCRRDRTGRRRIPELQLLEEGGGAGGPRRIESDQLSRTIRIADVDAHIMRRYRVAPSGE